MPAILSPDAYESFSRLDDADVIFVGQDGFVRAPARIRCYSFARALNRLGLRAEVLSFFDHLGATDHYGPLTEIPEEEKIRLNLAAFEALSRNPRAVLYLQKTGYNSLAVMLAAARNGNPVILDYDDYEMDAPPFRRLQPWLPSLSPAELLPRISNRAFACVAASHKLYDLIAPHNPNTHLIHTVADSDIFNPSDRARPRTRFGDAVNLLWCGDVWGETVLRDVLFAVDAFALMPRRVRAKARLHVVGFGHAWETTKRRVRERHPDISEIVLHEHIQPAEFGRVLAEMDIGLLPYAHNEFNAGKSPTKMFEFLVSKVAVLSTPVGEVTRCLEHRKSALFADGLLPYSEAMTELVDDDTLRSSIVEEAYRIGMERYTLAGVAPRLAALVREAAAPREVAVGITMRDHLTKVLRRTRGIAPREALLARRDLDAVLSASDPAAVDHRRWTETLGGILSWPGLAGEGVDAASLERARDAFAVHRNAARLRPRLALASARRPSGPPRLNKLAGPEDWEDEAWYAWGMRRKADSARFERDDPGVPVDYEIIHAEDRLDQFYSLFKRDGRQWRDAHAGHALERLGVLGPSARLLVVADRRSELPLLLASFARVDAIDISDTAAGDAARVAAGEVDPWLVQPRVFPRDRLTIHHGFPSEETFADRTWDAVVLADDTLNRSLTPALAAWLDARLVPGGVAVWGAEARLDRGRDVPGVPPELVAPSGLGACVAASTGWTPVDEFDASISDSALDRLIHAGTAEEAHPRFVTLTGDTLHAAATWVFRKTGENAGPDGWARAIEGIGDP